MPATTTSEVLRAQLLGSNEFYQSAGGTDTAWANALYQQLLGRSPSASEINVVVAYTPAIGRTAVATAIATSTDARAYLVNTWYSQFAHRAPAAAELAWWQAAFSVGFTDQQIMGGIMTLGDVEAATQN